MGRNYDKKGRCRVCDTAVTAVETWTGNGEGTNFGWKHAEDEHDDHRAEVQPDTEVYADTETRQRP